MNLLLNEHEQIITQQGLEFTEIRKENTRVNALVSNPQPGDHSLNPTVQTRLELLVSQNENVKESQNVMAGEIAEIRIENQKIMEFYTEAREHMVEQAKQIESRDEELTALRQNYARLRKIFKDLRGTVEELPKATLPTNDLPLLYLNKLQEIREDVDHASR